MFIKGFTSGSENHLHNFVESSSSYRSWVGKQRTSGRNQESSENLFLPPLQPNEPISNSNHRWHIFWKTTFFLSLSLHPYIFASPFHSLVLFTLCSHTCTYLHPSTRRIIIPLPLTSHLSMQTEISPVFHYDHHKTIITSISKYLKIVSNRNHTKKETLGDLRGTPILHKIKTSYFSQMKLKKKKRGKLGERRLNRISKEERKEKRKERKGMKGKIKKE